ncbi:LytTR family DNA-binding domain-containing protein [Flavobacterium sp. PL02]|uniref:LytR/AlgR family response regulator transcription factor n=1 Tax=Flavobacterium sp. PL02 TaxID=3088354 RepID=UPI002B227795|nr:LytTR family DNA-binding domain-containing protein [Flavobacterium sp. PL02]MEA9415226.1 LytTR family DNA-binding domain-containing protein [Flavobacterium sp. PL02]
MKNYSYIIIDDNQESVLKTKELADGFSELIFVAIANTYQQGLNLVLEHNPNIIFLEIDPKDNTSNLSLSFINELYHYLRIVPKVIITTTKKDFAFDAIKYGVMDYLLKPLKRADLLKTILKLDWPSYEVNLISNQTVQDFKTSLKGDAIEVQKINQSLVLCVKSYGDYRYIQAKDITYIQADNNSTDIYLNTGEMITAFKTLKYFEAILLHPFIRIHNSYIINRNHIARIHTGNSVCYIKNSTKKLPFSKTYKRNVEIIIAEFANGNYIEV